MYIKKLHTRLLVLVIVIILFPTRNIFAQSDFWQQTSGPVDPNSGLVDSDILSLANTSSGVILCTIVGGKAFKTTNNGASWNSIPLPPPVTDALTFAVNSNDEIFLSDFWNSSLVRSTDNGNTWDTVSTPFYDGRQGLISHIKFNNQGYIFLYYDDHQLNNSKRGFYKSTDDGASWTKAAATGLTNPSIISFEFAPNNDLYVATETHGLVYRSTNDGENFTQTNFAEREWLNKVAIYSDGTVFVGGEGGFWYSTDNGDTWTIHNTNLVNPSDPGVKDIVVDNNGDLYATPFDGGAGVSHDKGNTWTRIDDGLTTTNTVNPLLIANNYLFAGSRDAGVFRSVSTITAVELDNNVIPNNFMLSQNYPNPFNPITSIQYGISRRQFVALKIYNVLGREITTLANEVESPGNYEVKFNATNLPSGIYFYRLQAGSFVETKKMILLK